MDVSDGISFTDSKKINGVYREDTTINGGGKNAKVVDLNDDDDYEGDPNDVDSVENMTIEYYCSDYDDKGVRNSGVDGVNAPYVVYYEKFGEDSDVDSAQCDFSDNQNPGDESSYFL